MIVITDVNIIISALIKDATTREIILNSEQDFFFPEPSLHKIRKYKEMILEKSQLSEIEFQMILNALFHVVRIISTEDIMEQWEEAKKIMEHIDPEDVIIIAAALSQEEAVIWSDDKHFDQQNKIMTLKTKDMVDWLQREE